MTNLSKRRAKISKRLDTYYKRREMYRESISLLSKKIKRDNREIGRIDNKIDKIKKLAQSVRVFTGLNFRSKRYRKELGFKIATGFFYKYGVENGIRASELMGYMNINRSSHARYYRVWISKLINTNDEIRQRWENFKEYIKNP